jgi:hypothetical protein
MKLITLAAIPRIIILLSIAYVLAEKLLLPHFK